MLQRRRGAQAVLQPAGDARTRRCHKTRVVAQAGRDESVNGQAPLLSELMQAVRHGAIIGDAGWR
jgi:hypothetical protein